MQGEINSLEVDKAKYKQVFKELETKLRVEMESMAQERESWKDKNLEYLRQLHASEQSINHSKRKINELTTTTLRLTEKNVSLDNELKVQEKRLAEIVSEYQRTQDELEKLRAYHKKTQIDKIEQSEQHAKQSTELRKSSEQLRLMAEKVFQLLGSLQRMDEWKLKATDEQLKNKELIEALKSKCESVSDQLVLANRKADKCVHALEQLEEKYEKQKVAMNEHKKKFMEAEKLKMKLLQALKSMLCVGGVL